MPENELLSPISLFLSHYATVAYPSIERTSSGKLRLPAAAAHVKRYAAFDAGANNKQEAR
jgi:hypothetical protein